MFGFFKKKKKIVDSGAEMANTGLTNISDAINRSLIDLEQGRVFDDIYSHFDTPDNTPRVTYVMFSPTVRNKVIARCAIILTSNNGNLGVWSVDWAVEESYRNQGYGTSIVTKAIHEFSNGMKPQMPNGFYLEAIASVNNIASNKIASKLLGNVEKLTNPDTKEVVNNYLIKL